MNLEVLEKNELLRKITDYIKDGVPVGNGVIRPYDIIDLHQIMPDGLKELSEYCKNFLGNWDCKPIKLFINKNSKPEKLDDVNIAYIFNEKLEINCRKDSEGFPIQGTGRIITKEEKANLLNYLKQSLLPLDDCTYNAAYIRYINEYPFDVINYGDERIKRIK